MVNRDGSSLPQENVSNKDKLSDDYGVKYAEYIYSERFTDERINEIIENNSYATGYSNVDRIKRFLLDGQKKSSAKLNFTPLPIIPKYLKVGKKNLNLNLYKPRTSAVDNFSTELREEEKNHLISKMINSEFNRKMSTVTNMDFQEKGFVPENDNDIDSYMESELKLPQEAAMEGALSVVRKANVFNVIQDKLADDVMISGRCIVHDRYDPDLGVVTERIEPSGFITSYDRSEMNDNRGSFYNGHTSMITLGELSRVYGLKEDKAVLFANTTNQKAVTKIANKGKWSDINGTMVQVLFFEFKTTLEDTYRKKKKNSGKISIKKKSNDYDFNYNNIETYKSSKEAWIEGVWLIDSNIVLNYGIRNNQVIDSLKKVRSAYSSYDTNEMAMVRKMIPFADKMHIASVKIDQMIAAARPKGIAINVSSLLEVPNPDGSGKNYSYLRLIDMFNGTGNQLFKQDEFSAGQGLPLTELENGLPNDIGRYVDIWNHNLQQIHNIVGFDPVIAGMGASDRTSTESNRMSLASSIKSIEYIRDAVLNVEDRLNENIIIRIQDIDKYDKPFKKYVQAMGRYNIDALSNLKALHPFTFSLYTEMLPTVEEKQEFSNDLTLAFQSQSITISDKMFVQNISNIKLARMILDRKIKENDKKKQEYALQQSKVNQQAEMAKLQAEGQKIQLQSNADIKRDYQKYLQEKDLLAMKLQLQQQTDYQKSANQEQQRVQDKTHKNDLAVFKENQTNQRQDQKLEAYKEGQLSKDSTKNMEKSVK